MTTPNQPTEAEINEAAERLIDPHALLNDLEIFKIAISWLQNYQTQGREKPVGVIKWQYFNPDFKEWQATGNICLAHYKGYEVRKVTE